ncbi:hypothetical protein C2G38_2083618 [Gigaspora rosea]|uniref:Uncharacterized protein n=1 Tax=Gigaspora rosea TaxID=44941 RepID=A0A397V9U1_9GLOM|nr:hypothetical protein C2G38_2083618 [Gigaspora rosea]
MYMKKDIRLSAHSHITYTLTIFLMHSHSHNIGSMSGAFSSPHTYLRTYVRRSISPRSHC